MRQKIVKKYNNLVPAKRHKKMKKITSIMSVFVTLAALVAPVLAIADIGAQFNYMSGDLKTLAVANRTTGTGWQDNAISANSGDSVAFKVYYHNGVLNSVAHNTRIRLTFPTDARNTINVSASLGADNAATIVDNVVINSSAAQTLTIDPSSFRWYPNQSSNPTSVSATASGAGFVELNIGDIQGCWPYQGYITVVGNLAPVSAPTLNYNLSITKLVRNQTQGQGAFTGSTNANSSDRLVFQIQVANTGNTILNNVVVRDNLPSVLTYFTGTTQQPGGTNFADGIIGSGINIGSIVQGEIKTIIFETHVNSPISAQTAINYGYARADQVNERNANASVYISASPSPSPTPNYNLSITKLVRNQTRGGSIFTNSTDAYANDRLNFQIQVANTGNTALSNVIVWDVMPYQINYVPGSAKNNGSGIADIISGGVNIGSLNSGATATISFDGIVASSVSAQTVTNNGYVRTDQVAERSANALIYLLVSPSPSPTPSGYLTINKTVRNSTSGSGSFSESANAQSNDRVAFQIQINNNSNATVNNIYVRDILPSGLSYNYGSARLDGNSLSDGLVSGGTNIGSMSPGASRTILFDANIGYISTSYGQTLTNYAYVRADQVSEISDTANVFVNQNQGVGNLNISKTVRNITTGTNMQSLVNANVGDRVLFLIQVSTPVNASQAYNVRVWDTLPSGLSYISGSTKIDNAYTGDGLVSGGISLGAMSANQNRSINFEATVNSSFYGSQTITNYAYTSADNIGQRSDFAQVVVGSVIYPTPTYYPTPTPTYAPAGLTKYVDNLTSPNGTRTDNTARLGDILKYTLVYTNNTGAAINNVQIFDVLPSYTVFLSADNNGYFTNSSENKAVWNIGLLNAGATATVSYQARVENVPENNFVIVNSAAVQSSNFGLINSNEVRTTVQLSTVKGAYVKAVTGGNDLARNAALSLIISMWGIFMIYLIMEHEALWKNLRFKFILWKIRLKEKAM